MFRAFFLAVPLVFLTFSAGTIWAQNPVERTLKNEWRFGEARVRHLVPPEECPNDCKDGMPEERLEVRVRGKLVIEIEDMRFYLDKWLEAPAEIPFPPVGTNLTGGSHPQMIIQAYSGGPHCCLGVHILDLGPKPALIPVPFGGNYGVVFMKHEGERSWIAYGPDPSYAYWPAGFVKSPAPDVELRFTRGKWRLAADRMRRPVPPAAELEQFAKETRESKEWDEGPAADLWHLTLDLVYAGHFDTAERFFDMAWNPRRAGKEEFKKELFGCELRFSPFWPELAAMNRRKVLPPECGPPKSWGSGWGTWERSGPPAWQK